ncbi:MAG: hypothetical protein ACRBCS_03075 [Cellvibrionaceae bacterium]
MNPTQHEKESKRLMGLLIDAGLRKGEAPYYGEVSAIDQHTAMLCEFCQKNDVSKYSLELQIWWRDHQKADKDRLEREQEAIKTKAEKDVALEKLTDYERKLLGL